MIPTLISLINYFKDIFKARGIIQELCIENGEICSQNVRGTTYVVPGLEEKPLTNISIRDSRHYRRIRFESGENRQDLTVSCYIDDSGEETDKFLIEYSVQGAAYSYRIEDESIQGEGLKFIRKGDFSSSEKIKMVFDQKQIENNLQVLKTLSASLPFVVGALKIQSERSSVRDCVFTFFGDTQGTEILPRPLADLVVEYSEPPAP